MSATRKLSPHVYEKTQAETEREGLEIPASADEPPERLQARLEREAPEVPAAPQKYGVTLMIDPGTAMDETHVSLLMTEDEIKNVLCGAHPFIRLPKRYSRHPSGYDGHETIYLNVEDVTQVRIDANWPHPSPD